MELDKDQDYFLRSKHQETNHPKALGLELAYCTKRSEQRVQKKEGKGRGRKEYAQWNILKKGGLEPMSGVRCKQIIKADAVKG